MDPSTQSLLMTRRGRESASFDMKSTRTNKSSALAAYLKVGSRNSNDLTICFDFDMMSSDADGRLVQKDGTPCSEASRVR